MKLTEKEIMYILHEAKMLLTEDQEGDSIKKAIALYMDIMGCDKKTAEKFVRIDLRSDFPNLRYKKPGKFILGVTRMFLNGDFRTGEAIQPLNTTLTYIASDAHYNEYDKNLNGLSANEIISRFSDAVKADAEADREKLAQQEYITNDDYNIVRVDSFNETSQYRQYCYPDDPWCITKYPSMLESYTNNGIGQFYFCLRNGFENMEPIQGDECPLDEYGLSMIAVCVDGNGRLKTSTCRWNHSNGGNDHILTTEQISNLIGRNFYDVFKPNNKWEEKITNLKQKLKNGEDINSLVKVIKRLEDNILLIEVSDRYNFYDENTREILSDKWFDNYDNKKHYKFYGITLNNEHYFFNIENKTCYDGDSVLSLITEEIKELLRKGVDIDNFPEGLIDYKFKSFHNYIEIRCLGDYHNIIEDGKILFRNWYKSITYVDKEDGNLYRVEDMNNGKFRFINRDEENVLGVEFDWVGSTISPYNTITISEKEKINIVSFTNPTQKLCKRSFNIWVKILHQQENGEYLFAGQDVDNEGTVVCDKYGNDLFNIKFRKIEDGYSSLLAFCTNMDGKQALLYYDDLTLSEWYDEIHKNFVSKYSPYVNIINNDKQNLINCFTKQLISDKWFDNIITTHGDVYIVEENDLYNFLILKDGDLLSETWYRNISMYSYSSNKFIVTNLEGKKNILILERRNPRNAYYYFTQWYDDISDGGRNTIKIKDGNESYEINSYNI